MEEKRNSDAKIKANMRYSAKTYKRIPLDVKINAADELKAFCAENNTGLNTYIKAAIKEKYLADTGKELNI